MKWQKQTRSGYTHLIVYICTHHKFQDHLPMNGRHRSLQIMLDILTSKPVHQVLNSAQPPWVSQAVGHATEIPRFHDLFRRNSSPLKPKWKRITNDTVDKYIQVQPKFRINMISKMMQKCLEQQPNSIHATCCLSMAFPCHTSKWSVAPAPMASPIALPPPLPTTCLPEKQSQDGIIPSWADRICTSARANSFYA